MKTSIQVIKLLLFLSVLVVLVAILIIITQHDIVTLRVWGLALTAIGSMFTSYALFRRLNEMKERKKGL